MNVPVSTVNFFVPATVCPPVCEAWFAGMPPVPCLIRREWPPRAPNPSAPGAGFVSLWHVRHWRGFDLPGAMNRAGMPCGETPYDHPVNCAAFVPASISAAVESWGARRPVMSTEFGVASWRLWWHM
jgi:hypothetical protein